MSRELTDLFKDKSIFFGWRSSNLFSISFDLFTFRTEVKVYTLKY